MAQLMYVRKKKVIAIMVVIATLLAMVVATMPTYAASSYLADAQKKFKVANSDVVTVKNVNELQQALNTAGRTATANKKVIVYAKPGTYNVSSKMEVPANVVLVAETNTNFKMTGSASVANRQFFTISGAVYGGTYDCNNVAWYGLRFENKNFNNVDGKIDNGWILYANVKNAVKFGIVAVGEQHLYSYVYKCNVSNSAKSGIAANEGAWMAVINGCTITGCEESGVSLSRSHINIVKNCIIKNNKGHGISTDITGTEGKDFCKLNKIMGNEISNNGTNGVYIDVNCKVTTVFSRNEIHKNKNNGLSLDAGAQVGNKNTIALAKNHITNNAGSNLYVNGKKTYVNIGKENDFSKAESCVIIKDGGTAVFSGNKNIMNDAKKMGIGVYNGSTLEFKAGTRHQIQNNGGFGVKVGETPSDKSKATLLNITFKNNKSWAVKVTKNATLVSYKGCNCSPSKSAANRIYKD